ncbi:MAG TPA: alpha/beta hydrolase [Myxococcota bacterium]
MPTVRAGDLAMSYLEAGAGARPFVLVHGFTGSSDDFADVLPALAAHGRTLAPDLRGHGATSRPGAASDYTFERLADDVIGFLDALGVERCDLLGHSMGGVVAQLVALRAPERVASLVLMDTAAGPVLREARPFLEGAARIALGSGMEALFQLQRANFAGQAARAPALARCVERMGEERFWARMRAKTLAMDPVAFATLGPLLCTHEGVERRLGEIRCPTTVLVGAQESAPLAHGARALAAGIPGARLVVIEDAAHSPQLENPEAWLAAVTEHLSHARRRGRRERAMRDG